MRHFFKKKNIHTKLLLLKKQFILLGVLCGKHPVSFELMGPVDRKRGRMRRNGKLILLVAPAALFSSLLLIFWFGKCTQVETQTAKKKE